MCQNTASLQQKAKACERCRLWNKLKSKYKTNQTFAIDYEIKVTRLEE